MAVATREPIPMGSVQRPPKAAPSASSSDRPPLHRCERISPVKNRMLEIGTSGTVRGEAGNILTYSALLCWWWVIPRTVALSRPSRLHRI